MRMEEPKLKETVEVEILPPEKAQEVVFPVQKIGSKMSSYHGVPSMPCVPQPFVYPSQIGMVGVSFSDAQRINFTWHMNKIELDKKREERAIELQYLAEKRKLEENVPFQVIGNYYGGNSEELAIDDKNVKIKELVKKFIKEKLLVKSRGRQFRNGRGFFIRNEEMNRHEFIEDKVASKSG